MNRVTITLTIDLPDGVVPEVGYSSVSPEGRYGGGTITPTFADEPPLPAAPPELFAEAQRIFEEPKYDPDVIVRPASQPVPTCSVHNREMTYFPAGITKSGPNQGKPRGAFYKCGVKDGDKWCQQRRDAA